MLPYFIAVLLLFGRFLNCSSRSYCDHFCYCDSRLFHWICRVPKSQNVQTLDLDHLPNSLSKLELTNLHIKQTIRLIKFKNLIELRLRNVGLNELPKNYFQPNLITLDVSTNNLKKLTNTMLQMPALEQLDLSKNQLTTIDNLFDHLNSLKQLNLSSNLISKLTEHSFRNLTQLQYLNLKSNRIHQIELGTFYQLNNLVKLVLDDNMRLDHLKLDLFALRMRSLHLAQTNLTAIPQSIDEHIRELYLDHNLLERLTIGDFEHLINLRVLHLEHNLLNEIEYDTFGRMNYLVELYLSSNHLLQVPQQLPKLLNHLSLSDNLITELNCSNLMHLAHLQTLDLSSNYIQTLDIACLSSFVNIQHLDLSENQLITIDEQFIHLKQLKSLNLSGNQLIRLSAKSWSGLKNLKQLELSSIKRQLSCFNDLNQQFIFNNLPHLQILNLSSSPYLADCLFNYEQQAPLHLNSLIRRNKPINENNQLILPNLEKLIAKDLKDETFNKLNLTKLQINIPQLVELDIENQTINCDNLNFKQLTNLINESLKIQLQLINLDEWTCAVPKQMRNKKIIDLILINQTKHSKRPFTNSELTVDRLNTQFNQYDYTQPRAHQLVNLKNQIKWSKLMSTDESQLMLKFDNQPLLFNFKSRIYLINLIAFTIFGFLVVALSHLIIRKLQIKIQFNTWFNWFRTYSKPTSRFKHVNYSKQHDDVFIITQTNCKRREIEQPLISLY